MKKAICWKKKFLSFGVMLCLMLFMAACSPGNGEVPTGGPWTATATEDTWLSVNPYQYKHDGGWVYSASEDVFYAIYGQSNDGEGRDLYRIDHINHTSTIVAYSSYSRHGSQPVIDDTGAYVYLPPSENSNGLERYNTSTTSLETLASAPTTSMYSHGTWKNGYLWIVLDNYNLYYYDPTGDAWHDTGVYFGDNANLASSGASSNLIYIMVNGGAFYSYDVTTSAVVTLASPSGGFNLGGNNELTWFDTSTGDGTGYIYCAENSDSDPEIYDIANNAWHTMRDPHAPNSWAGHATYDSSRYRLYVTGESNTVWYYQF